MCSKRKNNLRRKKCFTTCQQKREIKNGGMKDKEGEEKKTAQNAKRKTNADKRRYK